MTQTIEVKAWGGENYEVIFDGTMWVNPDNGAQYSTPGEAMRAVLYAAAIASGDDPEEDEDLAQEVDNYVEESLEAYYAD